MKTYEFQGVLFTEIPPKFKNVPLIEGFQRVQVTEFDHNKRPQSTFMELPENYWKQALEGDEFNRKVIKRAYEQLRDNGLGLLMNAVL